MFSQLFIVCILFVALSSGFMTEHCKQSAATMPFVMKCAQEILGKESIVPEDIVVLKNDEGKLDELDNCMAKLSGVTESSSAEDIIKIVMEQLDIPDEARKAKVCDALKACVGSTTGAERKKIRVCIQQTMQELCM